MEGTTHRMGVVAGVYSSDPALVAAADAAVQTARLTDPDWPGDEVRAAVSAILGASLPSELAVAS